MTLKEAESGDRDDGVSLLTVLYRGDVGPDLEGLGQEYISAQDHVVLPALKDDREVGVLVGSYRLDIDFECRAGFVDAIVVEPSQRNQGIGTSLLREFAGWARTRGCTALNPNRSFFERAGLADRGVLFEQIAVDELEAWQRGEGYRAPLAASPCSSAHTTETSRIFPNCLTPARERVSLDNS